jgi:hemerythrin-like metal-binding protein
MEREPPSAPGVHQLDVEHRQIHRRLQQIATALTEGRREEVPGVLKFLHSYLSSHFAHEEEWMEQAGYPGAREHARVHAAILDGLGDARAVASAQPDELVQAAPAFAAALERHMAEDDLKLARFFTARQNLRLLAEAGPGVGVSLTPLPGSQAPVRPGRE